VGLFVIFDRGVLMSGLSVLNFVVSYLMMLLRGVVANNCFLLRLRGDVVMRRGCLIV